MTSSALDAAERRYLPLLLRVARHMTEAYGPLLDGRRPPTRVIDRGNETVAVVGPIGAGGVWEDTVALRDLTHQVNQLLTQAGFPAGELERRANGSLWLCSVDAHGAEFDFELKDGYQTWVELPA